MGDGTTIAGSRNRAVQVQKERRGGFGKAKQKAFLDNVAATCNVTASARAAGVNISTCYWHRKHNPAFAQLWQEALTIGYERLEASLLQYAIGRVAAHDIEPEAADPEAINGSISTALQSRMVTTAELQFALSLLNRHEAGARGRAASPKGRKRASAAETDAALTKKLDMLARQMAKHGK